MIAKDSFGIPYRITERMEGNNCVVTVETAIPVGTYWNGERFITVIRQADIDALMESESLERRRT